MVPLLDLWLPILVSGAFVFVVSSVIHMALPIHKNDMKKLPAEDQILAALRAHGVGAGMYMFPACSSMKDMGSPEMQKKLAEGPIGTLVLRKPGGFSMGPSLLQWFLLSLLVSTCAAYIAGLVLPAGADGKLVLRITSTAAFLGYAFSSAIDSIWKAVPWSVSLKFAFDALLYALATGAAFAWLWPDLAT
jgi:hypothetical protein